MFEQVLREARKLGVDLELDARGQEGEALEQALDVGVGALEGLEAEAAGDLGELLGELLPRLADVLQLAVVVAEQARIHQPPPLLPRSMTVDRAALEVDLGAQEQAQRAAAAPTARPRCRSDMALWFICFSSTTDLHASSWPRGAARSRGSPCGWLLQHRGVDAGGGPSRQVGHAEVEHRPRDMGYARRGSARAPRLVVLSSQARSRRTHSRSRLGERTRSSRDSWFSLGSSSVSRSSSDGCSRSFCVSSAMIRSRSGRPARTACVERDRADFQQSSSRLVRGEHALAEACAGAIVAGRATRSCAPCGWPRSRASLGARVARGNQRHDLAAVGTRSGRPGSRPGRAGRPASRSRIALELAERNPVVLPVDDRLEDRPEPRVGVGDPGEGLPVDLARRCRRLLEGLARAARRPRHVLPCAASHERLRPAAPSSRAGSPKSSGVRCPRRPRRAAPRTAGPRGRSAPWAGPWRRDRRPRSSWVRARSHCPMTDEELEEEDAVLGIRGRLADARLQVGQSFLQPSLTDIVLDGAHAGSPPSFAHGQEPWTPVRDHAGRGHGSTRQRPRRLLGDVDLVAVDRGALGLIGLLAACSRTSPWRSSA